MDQDLEQQAFAIVSQLLEFWQHNYLISKEELSRIKAEMAILAAKSAPRASTPSTQEPKPAEPEIVKATDNTSPPSGEDRAQSPPDIAEAEAEPVHVNEIPNVVPKKVGPKLKFGKQIPANVKPNGSWNYYTNLLEAQTDKNSFLFQTIFSTPTMENPVPKATATVWFQVTKRMRWNVQYRFEHHNQAHLLSFGEMVPYTGFNIREEAEIKEQANLIAKPLKRLQEVIESKSTSHILRREIAVQ
jgi:hypothetical protein